MLSLAACGEESGTPQSAINVSDVAGKAPEVKYDGDFTPSKVEVSELKAGKGPKAKADDLVSVHVWLQNSYDEAVKIDTYQKDAEPLEMVLSEDIQEGFRKAVIGHSAGAVTLVTGPANEVFPGTGYLVFGVGDEDGLVLRAEILEIKSTEERDAYLKKQKDEQAAAEKKQKESEEAQAKALEDSEKLIAAAEKNALPKAKGRPVRKADWAPKVDFSTDVPTMDFSGKPKPTGKLQVTELIKGKGKTVKAGDGVAVKYVGQVWGGDAPFDSSYSRGDNLTFVVGAGQMIKGFDAAVVGKTVGTRIIVQIPPAQGYGENGNEAAGIKGTDTIVFAVDIVGAS
ncbi:FKBP-type peptidyl-prolyl cis-trans isomerase [Nocardioides yefusunii]|uniref:peptidylprolyl isomerase n=2 Tax=Nocardioides yefusunii TaxID=2500546 RepID=A0ABW1QU93_9ACTN|nr:FKBP-type peptidyl-prolyl cis-trans isomerase [Nocardioides yefusunii]